MKRKVLVIAADLTLRAEVARILQPAGYLVESAANKERARELLDVGGFDAAIVAQSRGAVREVPKPPELLSFGGRTVDLTGHTLHAEGREVSLSQAEFQLLETFVRRPGQIFSRDQIRDAVPGRNSDSSDRAIDMLVSRLREKIEPDQEKPRFILTVRGFGYKFATQPQHAEPPSTQAAPDRQQPELRIMTVLAGQISGFMALAAKHDLEDVHIATSRAYAAIEKTLKPFDVAVDKTHGGRFLVYFGYPKAHEDDAERAVRAALELVRSMPNADVGFSTRLHLRVGIATGDMLVGGMDMSQSYSATGDRALHLQSAAPVDSVVVDVDTHEQFGRFFDCEELERIALEEGTVSVRAWRVTGESAAVASRFDSKHRAGMLELVDRKEQIKLLTQRWRQAKRRSGQVVMLTGEPGIGKSRLLAEFEDRVAAEPQQPHVCLRYFGLPHQTNASMFAVISELNSAGGFERTDHASVKLDKLKAMLHRAGIDDTRSISLISDLLFPPSETGQSIAQRSPDDERKKETFEALLDRIRGLAAVQPVLMIVDDIHWIDPASLEFLARVVEHVHALRVLMLTAARPRFSPPWPDDHAYMTKQELQRLAQSDAELLLERVAGGKSLPHSVTEKILKPADGVPLFIEELTKTVLETGTPHDGKEHDEADRGHVQAIPRTLRRSLLERLDRLGAGREVAQIGAVIGREFSYELLYAVANKPEEDLRPALDGLGHSGLVYGRGAPRRETYMFKHALVRDAAYGMLPRRRKNGLHGAIARALEEKFPEIVRAQPELLAHHHLEAGHVKEAVGYLSTAGKLALSRSALTEASKQIAQALKLIATLPDDDSRRRDELKLQIALARTLLEQKGYADIAVGKAYAKAADWSKRVDDPERQLAVHYGLWAHHYIGGQPAAMLKEADEFLAFAQRQKKIGPVVTGHRLVGHRLVGTAHLINGEIEKANTALDLALAHYDPEEHGATSPVGQDLRADFGQDVGVTVHSYRSWARWLSGRPDQAADAAAKAEAIGRASPHKHSLLYALWHAGMANVMLRDGAEVARLGSELSRYANERQLPYWQALGLFLQGWHARHFGNAFDAIERLEQGLEFWKQTGSRVFRPVCLAFLADAYAAADQPGLAGRTFQEALEIAADTGERWAEPEIHRLFGDFLSRGKDSPPPAAIARYEEAVATARRQGSRSFELRATMSLARIVSPTGGPTPWHERLSAIYQTFTKELSIEELSTEELSTEELSTERLSTDLSEARALLAARTVSRA